MKVEWRFCKAVEAEHKRNRRQYAHTFHYENTICLCRDFWELPKENRDGILLHELGHLMAGGGTEDEANEAALEELGARIAYEDGPYGRQLEQLENMTRRRNRSKEMTRRRRNATQYIGEQTVAYDEWIPTHAVMFHENGEVSLLTEEPAQAANWGRRNAVPGNDARRERMLHELSSDLADMVAAGEITATEANDWYNMKADQWAHGLG